MLDFIMLFSFVLSIVALSINQLSLIKRIEKAEVFIQQMEEASSDQPDLDMFK